MEINVLTALKELTKKKKAITSHENLGDGEENVGKIY